MTAFTISGAELAATAYPNFSIELAPDTAFDRLGRMVTVAYRPRGAEAWLVDGVVFTDKDGVALTSISVALPDGDWEIRGEAKDPANPADTLFTEALVFTVAKAQEAPVMPPAWDSWDEESSGGRYGFLGSMAIGTEPEFGQDLGRVLPINIPKPKVVYSLSGDGAAGLTIHVDTGMVEVIDEAAFSTPGIRYLTVTATNAVGEASVTVPFRVLEPRERQWFIDALAGSDDNDGLSPQRALKTVDRAVSARRNDRQGQGTIHLRRGGVYPSVGGIYIQSDTTWTAYGDPAEAAPHVVVTGELGAYQENRQQNFRIEDIHLSAGVRCFEGRDADGVTLLRVTFSGNSPDSKNGGGLYAHGYSNFRMLHCTVADGITGDGVYLRKLGSSDRTSANKILHCSFGIPRGGASDNLQITSERKQGMECFDVVVAHSVFAHDRTSDSTKGNLVIEGCEGFLVEQNSFSGRYFCASILSNRGTVRDNRFAFADLDGNSFALGSGGLRHTGEQRWLFNTLVASTWGMSLSGYDDPEGGWQRFDYEIHLNSFRGNRGIMKIDRPMSGSVRFNVAEFNGDATIMRRADGRNIAVGGAYTAFEGQPNWFNAGAGPDISGLPGLKGVPEPGQTVGISVPVIVGAEASVIWLINDQPVGELGGDEFVVPEKSENAWMPRFAAQCTLGAAVIYTDVAGNRTIVPVRFADGGTALAIGPLP